MKGADRLPPGRADGNPAGRGGAHRPPGRRRARGRRSWPAGGGLKIDDLAETVMQSLSSPDEGGGNRRVADGFRGAEGGERFGELMERLAERARIAAKAALAASPRRAETSPARGSS